MIWVDDERIDVFFYHDQEATRRSGADGSSSTRMGSDPIPSVAGALELRYPAVATSWP
jgi:hypothetical protein